MVAEGWGDVPIRSAEMPREMKPPGWVMAELNPESLRKRLNWLQNTVMALAHFCAGKARPRLKLEL